MSCTMHQRRGWMHVEQKQDSPFVRICTCMYACSRFATRSPRRWHDRISIWLSISVTCSPLLSGTVSFGAMNNSDVWRRVTAVTMQQPTRVIRTTNISARLISVNIERFAVNCPRVTFRVRAFNLLQHAANSPSIFLNCWFHIWILKVNYRKRMSHSSSFPKKPFKDLKISTEVHELYIVKKKEVLDSTT